MTRDEIAADVIDAVLAIEGGVADVGDGMGVTRWGQTERWLTEYGLPIPTTVHEAHANYRRWLDLTNLIVLCDRPDAVAYIVVNFAVHSHARTAIRALQTAIGATPDGVLGPKTEAALARLSRTRLALIIVAAQTRQGTRAIERDHSKAVFAAGWGNRWADSMERIADEIA